MKCDKCIGKMLIGASYLCTGCVDFCNFTEVDDVSSCIIDTIDDLRTTISGLREHVSMLQEKISRLEGR